MGKYYYAESSNLDIEDKLAKCKDCKEGKECKKTKKCKGSTVRDNLKLLAIDLMTNHCTASFGEEEKKKVRLDELFDSEEKKRVRLDELFDSEGKGLSYEDLVKNSTRKVGDNSDIYLSDVIQHRNILIIGAGATYDAYKAIPLGAQVIDKFEKTYKANIEAFPALKEKFDNHIRELKLQGREPDFENMLSLYSELIFTHSQLRSEISGLFKFRYCPSLFYELVAHMFKHSFIDVIINFNFDEMLDQAIEEELGSDNYYHILSDGDCVPIEDMMLDGRLKVPIYIKPHGSVSHRSTLRFTKRHYLDVPEQIQELLVKLISGERGDVSGKKKEEVSRIQQVNIISAGFNMESLEFGDILDLHLPKDSKIYHISFFESDKRDPFFVNAVLPSFWQRAYDYHIVERNHKWDAEELHKKIYKRIAVEKFNHGDVKNELTTPFSEIFSYVWRTMYYAFRKHLRPRSIGRHEIINYFFYNPAYAKYSNAADAAVQRKELLLQYENSIDYFLDRTIVEIAISINRNNGIVEISQLLGDRPGFYYKKYRNAYFQEKKTHHGALSIYSLINRFGSKEYRSSTDTNYSKNIFQLDIDFIEDELKADKSLSYFEKNGAVCYDKNNKHVIPNIMRRWTIKELKKNNANEFEVNYNDEPLKMLLEQFWELLHPDDVSKQIDPVPILVLNWLFRVKYLSQTFISNFLNNYNKQIFNSNRYELKTGKHKVVLIEEIARLFRKSNRRHYYSIRPRYHDSKNYLTESFTKNKILHTTLAVEYAFRQMFLDKDWDIALIISETGSILNFMEDMGAKEKKFEGKKIIMINSFDAIKRLHIEEKKATVLHINALQNEKYQKMLNVKDGKELEEIMYTFSLPSLQHNHHMMLFIKTIPENSIYDRNETPVYEIAVKSKAVKQISDEEIDQKDKEARQVFDKIVDEKYELVKQVFAMRGAMYIYRRGFSNSLNPVLLGIHPFGGNKDDITVLRHDFKKLMRIFSTTFCRALAFEGTKKINNLNIDFNQFQTWLPDEEVEKINELFLYLRNIEEAKFEKETSNDPLQHD